MGAPVTGIVGTAVGENVTGLVGLCVIVIVGLSVTKVVGLEVLLFPFPRFPDFSDNFVSFCRFPDFNCLVGSISVMTGSWSNNHTASMVEMDLLMAII